MSAKQNLARILVVDDEPDVEALVKKKVDRGAVSVTVYLTTNDSAARAQVDANVAARYHRELKKVAKQLKIDPSVSIR